MLNIHWIFQRKPTFSRRPKILFIQTEVPPFVVQAIKKIKEKNLYPESEIILFCRQQDRTVFEEHIYIDQIVTYKGKRSILDLDLVREIRNTNADIVCSIFSGRPFFKTLKILFCFIPIRRHLVFDAMLDHYYLTIRTLLRTLRKQPEPLFGLINTASHRVLLLQTESDQETLRALDTLLDPKVVPNGKISVFCSETKQHVFQKHQKVIEIFTYHPTRPWRNIRTLMRIMTSKIDVVAAIFSGRPIFLKHKLLYFLLPAHSRLVFNKKLDCFYLSWRNLGWFLTQQETTPQELFLKILRVFFYLPRFLYLIIWVMVVTLKKFLTAGQK
tara:strand:- start:73 stop:1056 length:984 start_codon:yes stop_codon:yes gene_type:complete